MTQTLPLTIPRPGYPLVGVIPQLQRDPLRAIVEASQSNPTAPIALGLGRMLVTYPNHVERILHDNQRNYLRGIKDPRVAALLGEHSLVTLEGERWRQQRRMMQPSFQRDSVAGYVQIMM